MIYQEYKIKTIMKLLKNIFKITMMLGVITILGYIMVSPFLCAMEDNYIHLYISIPLMIVFLGVVHTYDVDKLMKL